MADECEDLQARADMLHREASLGLEKALDLGPTWPGFKDQVEIANRCGNLAAKVDEEISEKC
jgi:hypothetical protein